jgi:hypothetical protein
LDRAHRRARLTLERLEERALPSNYTAGSVSDLIADINAANQAGGSNTITLTAPTTSPYVLTAADNSTGGANRVPLIKKSELTIVGNGDTIERSTASGTPAFRLFTVASGGSLTLENLTLQNGLAYGSGAAAEGGAIYNLGTLVLNGATVENNAAVGSPNPPVGTSGGDSRNGSDAAGGGIWSNGALTLENSTLVKSNSVWGGHGRNENTLRNRTGGNGGNAFGGGLYIAGGTVTLTSSTLSNNTARGGFGGSGGNPGSMDGTAYGGGLYVAGGTVTLSNDTVTYNSAGVLGFLDGYGGGLYLAGGTDYLDTFTVNNTSNNTAPHYPNIYGSYILN